MNHCDPRSTSEVLSARRPLLGMSSLGGSNYTATPTGQEGAKMPVKPIVKEEIAMVSGRQCWPEGKVCVCV